MDYLTPPVHLLPLDIHLAQGLSLLLVGLTWLVVLSCQEDIVLTGGHRLILQCITVGFPQAPYRPRLDLSDKLLDHSQSSLTRTGSLQ